MNGDQKFLVCELCGNLVGLINDKGIPLVCCGEHMKLLVPNTEDGSMEKHLPVINVLGDSVNVKVGGQLHPMEDGHHITFVYLETELGGQRKRIKIGAEPQLTFKIADDKPIAVYAHCNIHGLWKTMV